MINTPRPASHKSLPGWLHEGARVYDPGLSDVVFSECTLRLTEFGAGRYGDADLRGNDLSSIRGVANLSKIRITPAQRADLAQALVADLDIDVSDD
ncbi:hypothetical protein ABT143_05105 [Streptomyces sp. NPDC002033]|uniref:hypothetical protein n=1 Tax=unclassified Streptomyces TaxID=2593676 RepID=UPI00332519FC